MDPTENSQSLNLPDSTQFQREARSQEGAQVPVAEVGEAEATATASGDVSAGGMLSSPQRAERASSPPNALGSIAGLLSTEASGNPLRRMANLMFIPRDILNRKVMSLVKLLLLKYQMNQLATKAEMLDRVTPDYEMFFHVISSEATDCMWLLFGIEVMEVDPRVHSYSLVTALGITYDGMQHGTPGIPKTGLVIIMLCIIFIGGNCVSEQEIWHLLNSMGLYAGRNHFMYGEPRSLITEHFVQEGYLEYRQVPGSNPPSHEFLWGPRAHAETTKMKILNYFASIVRRDPRSYPSRYAEALADELQRLRARITQQRIPLP
ncbi:melanoma-associated antigen 11 [Phodopus roborovskii]|uniref:MGC114492 protein n=1 Tax=Phodopus roborovskii TaxID=109678 RepID=A0AAU9YXS7_PHORO|nr:melanoma-associated antigen 11 [Phodopus roborovskii]CAH6780036.1 MGC114492 [Phodopus roborovskii]